MTDGNYVFKFWFVRHGKVETTDPGRKFYWMSSQSYFSEIVNKGNKCLWSI